MLVEVYKRGGFEQLGERTSCGSTGYSGGFAGEKVHAFETHGLDVELETVKMCGVYTDM